MFASTSRNLLKNSDSTQLFGLRTFPTISYMHCHRHRKR